MQVKMQLLELEMKQWTGSKLGKEYVKDVYCYPAYLTSMQSTSCKNASLEWKLTFSRPVTTAEFSKFADALSEVL